MQTTPQSRLARKRWTEKVYGCVRAGAGIRDSRVLKNIGPRPTKARPSKEQGAHVRSSLRGWTRLLVEAIKYLAQSDPVTERPAIELISEHVRTLLRMSDSLLA